MFPLQSSVPRRITPLVTWGLIAVNAIVFFLYSGLGGEHVANLFLHLGLIPARYTDPGWAARMGLSSHDYSPFLWSMFLHGSLFHLVGNMWTLWIFGPNVEERMGPTRFLIFYLLAGGVAGLLHFWFHASATVPTIGASGAIAGVMGAYLALFPRAQVLFVVPIFFYPLFFVWPAAVYLFYWFLIQFVSGTMSVVSAEQVGGVAWWAHVGGFVFGAVSCRLFLQRPRIWNPPPDYPVYLYRGY